MKDKKTNVWVPVAVIIGILLVAMIVLTVFMVVTGRSAGNTGSSSSKYHADSTQSDVKPQDSDDYIQDVSLDEFSIGESSDDSSASDNAEAAEVAMEDSNGYILPDSDSRKLKKSDLAGMTAQQLSYAKNEIYARHGRVFKSSELQDYFNEKDWYEENDDFKDEDLSKKEAENTEFIDAYQKDNDLEYKPAK
ncbi:MAG: YARHG domain-containing protein [Lachnospiraceae bacterium]|nr:YARHG domain-containing protein [Lachnospiraceae bacterium]MDD7668641.1 YARHG domain-containing protein [Lachnospiraceae bacterium]MDY2620987.1 YARHG domain-containing protein [Agathobacter sp.]